MAIAIDNSKLVNALIMFREQFEVADPVYLARIVGGGDDVGTTKVDMLRPDGTVAERRDVRGNIVAWPGVYVRVARDRKRHGPIEMGIIGVDDITYAASSGVPALMAPHGDLHGYLQVDESTTLHPDQLYPLRCQPDGLLTVVIVPGLYFAEGTYRILSSAASVDLTTSQPGVGLIRYVTLSLDADGNVTVTDGTAAATVDVTDITLPPTGEYPVAAVRIPSWMTVINRTDIFGLKHIVTSDPGVTIELVNQLVGRAADEADHDLTRHAVEG